jgi:hypothetical protein
MKRIILRSLVILLTISCSSCRQKKERYTFITEEATEYESLEELLSATLIDRFKVPDDIEGYDTKKYYYISDKLIAAEYSGDDNTLVFIGIDSSYNDPYREDIFSLYRREDSEYDYRYVDIPYSVYGGSEYYMLKYYYNDCQGDDILYSSAQTHLKYDNYIMITYKPMKYEEITAIFDGFLEMTLKG